jgi:NhaA family Na+:H+ antiporter
MAGGKSDDARIHQTWVNSDRRVPTRFVRPFVRFTEIAASSGIVLLVAAVVALIWANGPFGDSYETFWGTHFEISVGSFHFDESLKHVVNDGLMAIFFFVVGLEIKREIVVGDLNDRKQAALPAIAALGGMVVPALIFVAFVVGTGGEATRGWGIPMATDIAFSIGVISLLGARVSTGAKLFLLALAIADDIGAIAVIAIFYTDDLSLAFLAAAIGGLGLVYIAQRVGIRSAGFYWVLGLVVWFLVFESGVHATLAGVALAFLTPIHAWYSDDEYFQRSRWILDRYDMESDTPRRRERVDASALTLASVARESVAPLDRLEGSLHPWSAFVVIPIFALANAGVRIVDLDFGEAVTSPVALGVGIGLLVGKIVGISLATWIAVMTGVGKLPKRTQWRDMFGLAALAGIGFTVSLFITELAFTSEILIDQAKIGIFIGSGLAGIVGYSLLRMAKTPQEIIEEGRELLGLEDAEASSEA